MSSPSSSSVSADHSGGSRAWNEMWSLKQSGPTPTPTEINRKADTDRELDHVIRTLNVKNSLAPPRNQPASCADPGALEMHY